MTHLAHDPLPLARRAGRPAGGRDLGPGTRARPHVPVEQVTRLVSRMNAEAPDLVALLGDYASQRVIGATAGAARRRWPRASGSCARRSACTRCWATTTGGCTGTGWALRMRAAGITVLENQAVQAGTCGSGPGRSARARAVDRAHLRPHPRRRPGARPQPRPGPLPLPSRAGVALTLAGHTHGSQINIPVLARLGHPLPLRHPLRRRPRGGGGPPPVREPRRGHQHDPGRSARGGSGHRPRSAAGWKLLARPSRRAQATASSGTAAARGWRSRAPSSATS